MENKKTSFYLIAISFVSTIGGFLFGYDTAIISGCNTFLEAHFNLTPAMLGWVVSSALLGTILGCVISGSITDMAAVGLLQVMVGRTKIGRRTQFGAGG